MRVLVFGAGGYLGRHAVTALRARSGTSVTTAARGSAGAVDRSAPDLRIDLSTAPVAELAELIGGAAPDAVVNCAGAVFGPPAELAAINDRGAAVLCRAIEIAAPKSRLVHLGSAGEYGATEAGFSLTEDCEPKPPGPYGSTKLAGTTHVVAADLDAVVLRVFNPIGPGAPASSLPGRLAGELRRATAAGAEPTDVRVGDLSAYRDFIDARCVADAIVAAATRPGPLPRILNIGSGTALRTRDLADTLRALAAREGFTGHIREDGQGSERSGALSWQQSDPGLARRTLDWHATRTPLRSLTDLWNSTVLSGGSSVGGLVGSGSSGSGSSGSAGRS